MKNIIRMQISYYIHIICTFALLIFTVRSFGDTYYKYIAIFDLVLMGITVAAAIYFGIRGMIHASRLYFNDDLEMLRKYMKIGKLGLLPFYILNFIYHFLLYLLLIAASHGILVMSPLPLLFVPLIVFTYSSVIFTSAYSIAFILALKKNDQIKNGKVAAKIILQLIFVLDIIGMFVLLNQFKKSGNQIEVDGAI